MMVCGCGAQARAQAAAVADVRRFESGFALDADEDRAHAFATEMSRELRFPFEVARSLGDAALASEVIITCTTAREPFLDETHVKPGTFVAAVGADSPLKNEIAPALMATASVFADVTSQALTMGDSLHANLSFADVRGELADLVSGRAIGRTGDEEIIVFDSTGTGLEDVASAAAAYERALGSDVAHIELANA